ncbi:MAG: aspartate aminotransferase family protein [Planctomycetes bacterium]|nr:aspartate aminotransferase family protein [Planctomycetota bacterium]
MTTQQTIDLFTQYVIGNYTRIPVVLVRGEGVHVWDADGKRYLDMFPGWAVNGIGHCHPRVTKALRDQAGILIHVANNFYNEPQGVLAELISTRSFGGQCFFCNSGAEANEAAIKLMRIHHAEQGRYKIITMHNSFHGRTLAAITATGQPKYHKGFAPLVEGFTYVPFSDLDAVKAAVDDKTCAVLVEPIQGEGGINVASRAYLQSLRNLCNDKGLLLILDEVQTGMGRTGRVFGYQHYDIEPDVMTLAKALGGGVAIGAMVAKPAIAKSLVPGTHAATFGGNPLACAAAVATFDAIEKDGLLENARLMGEYTQGKLSALRARFDLITEVRGIGLMIGVQLKGPGKDIVTKCMAKGLLINCTHDTVLRFMPPMTVRREHIDEAVAILETVLAEG